MKYWEVCHSCKQTRKKTNFLKRKHSRPQSRLPLLAVGTWHGVISQSAFRSSWGGSSGGRGVRSSPLNWNRWRQRNCKMQIWIRIHHFDRFSVVLQYFDAKEWHFGLKKRDLKTLLLGLKTSEIAFPRTWISNLSGGWWPRTMNKTIVKSFSHRVFHGNAWSLSYLKINVNSFLKDPTSGSHKLTDSYG